MNVEELINQLSKFDHTDEIKIYSQDSVAKIKPDTFNNTGNIDELSIFTYLRRDGKIILLTKQQYSKLCSEVDIFPNYDKYGKEYALPTSTEVLNKND